MCFDVNVRVIILSFTLLSLQNLRNMSNSARIFFGLMMSIIALLGKSDEVSKTNSLIYV